MGQQPAEIYLDNAATTCVCEPAVLAAVHAMQNAYGNPMSLHKKGLEAARLVTQAKWEAAQLLSCAEATLFFTSGATESNNMAILGVAAARRRQGNKIVTTTIEHKSIKACLDSLKQQGLEIVTIAPTQDGCFDPQHFADAVDERTILVSAMYVNNETGLILPIQEIGKAVKRKNPKVLFHVDAVQAFLKLPIKLRNAPIDLLSASGHKAHAPKGIGLLYVRPGVRLHPLLYGGNQQNQIHPGTESIPLIAAFSAAIHHIKPHMQKHLAHFDGLKQHLVDAVAEIPEITLNSNRHCAPYIVSLSVECIRSEVLLHFLEQHGIYVSSASACSSGAKSHVLRAMGLSDDRVDTALRISFCPQTTMQQLDCLVTTIKLGMDSLVQTTR